VAERPYTVLSCAISADGCLDDATASRLILSGPHDLDEVDALRAGCDAILAGAGTLRVDDPRLLVRSPARVAARQAAGRPPHPLRVTLTTAGDLDPRARFFSRVGPRPLVYCASPAVPAATQRLGAVAEVIGAGDPPSLAAVLTDLSTKRMVASVLVEGGSRILRDALAGDLADELRLAVAPFFIGDPGAPRFGLPASYPHGPRRPMRLQSARQVGTVAVLTWRLTARPRPAALPSPG
jgi:5-amino-6-(5-phosphoribosylamino)uracil reductase